MLLYEGVDFGVGLYVWVWVDFVIVVLVECMLCDDVVCDLYISVKFMLIYVMCYVVEEDVWFVMWVV